MTYPKILNLILVLSFSSLLVSCQKKNEGDFPQLTGPYLGQDPPGLKPEVFAPGVISTDDDEGCSGFLNNGQAFVFNRVPHGDTTWTYIPIYLTELKDGYWADPVPVSFQQGQNDDNFTVAPDGKTLYFQSMRPKDGSTEPEYTSLWKVIKTTDGWTTPASLEYENRQDEYGGYPSVTKGGAVYFASGVFQGFGQLDIYRFREENGKFTTPENLGAAINSEHLELDAFIAQDESFIILCTDRPGGHGEYDLYVSFMEPDGNWSQLVNMGPDINSVMSETRPSITPDGKFFFFCSDRNDKDDIYWVDAGVVREIKSTYYSSNDQSSE